MFLHPSTQKLFINNDNFALKTFPLFVWGRQKRNEEEAANKNTKDKT